MTCFARTALAWVCAALGVTAMAQFPSAVVGFNGPPIDDPATSQEMFRTPQLSGSTAPFIQANTAGQFDRNAAFRASGLQSEGDAAMQVFFRWVNPADVNAWLRLTTQDGQVSPNPALHTQGKVRFRITNRSELFAGRVGVCIGIRETGAVVPQLANGGATGPIEWVGVSGVGLDGGGNPRPIPVVWLDPFPAAVLLEFDLTTGDVSVDGNPITGGIGAMTGDGVLNAPNNRGTLEHIAFVNDPADGASLIDVGIDELQFEAPVTDPVVPPTIVAPILDGDQDITVTNLQIGVDRVEIFVNNVFRVGQNVATNDPVLITLPQSAETGEVYTATQRVGGITSPPSNPITVLAEPSPYTISAVLDEDADNCGFNAPGGWEILGTNGATTIPAPVGTNIFQNNAVWQAIDMPLDDPSHCEPWLGGNGQVDPSPNGNYSFDSIWLTRNGGAGDGPYTLYIDGVYVLDGGDNVIGVINSAESTVYMGSVRGQSPVQTGYTSTIPASPEAVYDGLNAHRVVWSFSATASSLGLYHNIGLTCNSGPDFTDDGVKIRFHVHARAPSTSTVALPVVNGPLAGNQTGVRVTNAADAQSLQLYVNGVAVGAPVVPSGTTTDFTGLSLMPGDSVSAKQVVGGEESDFAFPRGIGEVLIAPRLTSPIPPGSTSVTVTNCFNVQFATASQVTVTVTRANIVVDTATGTPVGGTATVTLNAAVQVNDVVTATQTVNGQVSLPSNAVTVGFPAPVIYAAPAEGDASVRVQGIFPTANQLVIRQNGSIDHTLNITPGTTVANVPVSGLVTGDTIVAIQRAAGFDSSPSASETVTVNTSTVVLCDDFEAGAAAYAAAWTLDIVGGGPAWVNTNNATPGGTASLFNSAVNQRIAQNITNLVPTRTNPMVWNVNIFDSFGPGAASGNIFAQINDQVTGFNFMHVGIAGTNLQPFLNTNLYQFRLVGNGGPDWTNLSAFDAPQRSIGWHTFTVVHKGTAVDVYVDGKLSAKNVTQTSTPQGYDRARIGPGVSNNITGNYDDFCIEVGKVRFGTRPPASPLLVAPIEDGDTSVTVASIESNVTLVQVIDAASVVLGSYNGAIPGNGQVAINLNRALVHLEAIRARVTNSNGTSTGEAREVGNGNGDIRLCIGIRETGDAGALGTPGATTGPLEWVGVTGVTSGAPQGIAVSPSQSWQTLTFDPTAGMNAAFPGSGNGTIDGTRGVLEHLAISVNASSANRSTGKYRLFVDNVVNVGAGGGGADFVITNFDGFALGTEVLFQEPTFSGSTAANLAPLPSLSVSTDEEGNPNRSELLEWFWKDTGAGRWIRVTTSSVAAVRSPIIDLTKPIRMDVLLLSDAPPALPGDVDGDGHVTLTDLARLLSSFGLCQGQSGYDPDADFNGDNCVNLTDLAILLANFGL